MSVSVNNANSPQFHAHPPAPQVDAPVVNQAPATPPPNPAAAMPGGGPPMSGRPSRSLPGSPSPRLATLPLTPLRRSASVGAARQEDAPPEDAPPEPPTRTGTPPLAILQNAIEAQSRAASTHATPESSAPPPLPHTPPMSPSPAPAAPPRVIANPTPAQVAQADADLDAGLENVHEIFEFLSSLGPTEETPDAASSSEVSAASFDVTASNAHAASGSGQAAHATPSPEGADARQPSVAPRPPSPSTRGPSPASIRSPSTGGAGDVAAPARAQRSSAEVWLRNILKVGGHEAIAVGLTTGIREVVAYLVRTAQNNAHGSAKKQEALAGAIVAFMGLGNLAAMAGRRVRGTNTATADIGNLSHIGGLIASTIGALRTGELAGLLPSLSKAVVYAGLRDASNTLKPYADNPHAGNPLVAQGWNTPVYLVNQLAVNWLQSNAGLSGAGLADKLHNVSTHGAEASAERRKIVKDAVGPGLVYVGANFLGETADKIAGSMLDEVVGVHGMAGIAQLAIGDEAWHLPSASEWGNMLEKTFSRMSFLGQTYGTTAAIGSTASPAKFGETGATAIDNFTGASTIALFCLPFVATLVRKARRTVNGANDA